MSSFLAIGSDDPVEGRRAYGTRKEVIPTMHGEPERAQGGDVWMVERAVVLQLLRDDHAERWPGPELRREIDDVAPATLEWALACLAREGVLHIDGPDVRASRSVRRLDELDLVAL